ncbi:hypothetical protein [Ralstonia sp. Ralssp135]|uniref:hypothetical protein n=1 Tax=Ralstonia sp. Ralssp135 TaxID=3243016 RepID=UPI0039AF17A2
MAREVIEKDKLLSLINDHMASLDACRNLRITSIANDPARTHGANWTTGHLRRSGSDHDQVECGEVLLAFMLDLQARYDI